jgi:hypothetical protein
MTGEFAGQSFRLLVIYEARNFSPPAAYVSGLVVDNPGFVLLLALAMAEFQGALPSQRMLLIEAEL